VTSFVCPYHAWPFAPDGALEGAPTMLDGEYIDYREYGLKPVDVDSWGGFLFIHFGTEEPSPLAAAFAQMSDKLPAIPTDGVKLVHEVHDLEANWKLVAENNLECYHCGVCHDVLCGAADLDSFRDGALRRAGSQLHRR
jgi:phenylpropionate dioxygenase-like ring-hydroxylating dioxygenase large terminal subunit